MSDVQPEAPTPVPAVASIEPTKALPPGVVWRDGKFVDLRSGKDIDFDMARDAGRYGKWNRAAVDDRRRQVWDMMARGVPENVMAKLFKVHRNTVVNDVRAIREQNRRTAKNADVHTEIGDLKRRFEDLFTIATENMVMAKKPSEKATFMANAIKVLISKAEFLLKSGVIPPAKIGIEGSLELSGGLNVGRMSLEELKSTRNDIIKRMLGAGGYDVTALRAMLPVGEN